MLAGSPRVVATADAKLIDALVGSYRLQSGLRAELRRKGNALTIKADGQPEFEMGFDSAGDFYPLEFDALLRVKRKADGTYALTWFQMGGRYEATRIDAVSPVATTWTPTEAELKEYEGNYPLTPVFALRVFTKGAGLFVQGTRQAAIEITSVEKDIFVASAVDAEIHFGRDAAGNVTSLTLKQGGKVSRGERH